MNILAVFTGGTIGSLRRGGAVSPNGESASLLLGQYQKTNGAAHFTVAAPYTILSENLDISHLKALRAFLEDELQKGYDGVIVCHGTDTLQYTAAYLDLVFGAGDVPIALVSANYPLEDERSNGFKNFEAAAALIKAGEKGVFVPYKNAEDGFVTVHRGCEVLPHLPLDDRLFSLFDNTYGTVKNGVFEKDPGYKENAFEDLSERELSGKVLWLRPYPGTPYPGIPNDTKAVLLEGCHSGTLPTSNDDFIRFCREADNRGVPLLLTGSQPGFEYESKKLFAKLNIRVLPPMSPIAAYVKLWLR